MKHLFLFVLLCTSFVYPINISINVHYDYLDRPICMTTKFVVNDKDTTNINNYINNPFTVYDSIITFKLTVPAPWSGNIKIIRKKFTFTNAIFNITNATTDTNIETYAKIKLITIIGKTIAANGDPLSDIKIIIPPAHIVYSKNGIYIASLTQGMSCSFYISRQYNPETTIAFGEIKSTDFNQSRLLEVDSIIVTDFITKKTYALTDTILGPDYIAPLEKLSGKILSDNEPISDVIIKLVGNTNLYDTTNSLGEFSFMTSPQFNGYIIPFKPNCTFTPSNIQVTNVSTPLLFKLNSGIPEFTCKTSDTIIESNTIGYLFNISYNNPTSLKETIIALKLPSWLTFTNNKLIGINQATSKYDTIKLALNINNINVDTLTLTLYMPNIVSIIIPMISLTKNHIISQIAIYDLKGRLITICNPKDLNKIMASKSKMIVITKAFTKSFSLINKSIIK